MGSAAEPSRKEGHRIRPAEITNHGRTVPRTMEEYFCRSLIMMCRYSTIRDVSAECSGDWDLAGVSVGLKWKTKRNTWPWERERCIRS